MSDHKCNLNKATMQLLQICNSKQFIVIRVYRNFYFAKTPYSDIIMLDGSAHMALDFFPDLKSISKFEEQEDNGRIIDSILHLYSNDTIIDVSKKEYCQAPLLFVTSIHCAGDQCENLKREIEQSARCNHWIYYSADTACFVILFNTYNYREITELLYRLIMEFPGIVCNSHVGCWKSKKDDWKETVDVFSINIAQRNPEKREALDDFIENKCKENHYTYTKLIQTGSSDICYRLNNFSGADIVDVLNELRALDIYYDIACNIQIDVREPKIPVSSKDRLSNSISLERLEEIRDGLTNDKDIAPYRTLHEMLSRLIAVFHRMERIPASSPMLDMLIHSLEGFVAVYDYALMQNNEEETFSATQKYLHEILRISNSTSYGLSLRSQTPGSSEIFCSLPERFITMYYEIVNYLSFILRDLDKSNEDKYFYLLAPDAYPTVQMQQAFPSNWPPYKRVLIVGFPLHLLYKPLILLPSLVHEIAHYAGDATRMREKRSAMMLEVITFYIYAHLYSDQDILQDDYWYLESILKDTVKKVSEKDSENQYYLQAQCAVFKKAVSILTNRQVLHNFARSRLGDKALFSTVEQFCAQLSIKLYITVMPTINSFINEIADIVSEVYADLVSIIVLNLKCIDYVQMLYFNGASKNLSTMPLLQERMHIVAGVFEWNLVKEISGVKYLGEFSREYKDWNADTNSMSLKNVQKRMIEFFVEIRNNLINNHTKYECMQQLYDSLRPREESGFDHIIRGASVD